MIDSLFGVQPSLSSHNTEVSVCLYCPPVTNIYHPGFCVWPAGKSQSHSATSGCIIQPSGHLRAPELVCGCTSIICIHSKCACSLSPGWWLFWGRGLIGVHHHQWHMHHNAGIKITSPIKWFSVISVQFISLWNHWFNLGYKSDNLPCLMWCTRDVNRCFYTCSGQNTISSCIFKWCSSPEGLFESDPTGSRAMTGSPACTLPWCVLLCAFKEH